MRLLLIFIFPFSLMAQPCDYARLMREGRAKLAGSTPAYSQALNKFNAARTCAPSKSSEVDREVARVFKMIEGERDRALLAEKSATEALRKLQAAIADVVRFVLRDADDRILRLDYEDAYARLKTAPPCEPLSDSVAFRLLEIAYFRHHSGNSPGAVEPFNRAADLLKKKPFAPSAGFDRELARLSSDVLNRMTKRYYPLMQTLPAGTFWMGRDTTLEAGKVEELPRHQVRIDSFALAQTEITFWQWNLFIASTNRKIETYSPTWGLDGNCAAVYMDWFDACEYANWLSMREQKTPVYHIDSISNPEREKWVVAWLPEGEGYRLPTEAEWEFAARGGSDGVYYKFAGSNDIDSVGWYSGNSTIEYVRRTHPVGEKKPVRFNNGSMIYDLTGNVWEWCWDIYDPKIYEAFSGSVVSNPRGASEWLKENVLRGCGWGREAEHARVSVRTKYKRHGRAGPDIGFRIARHKP